MRTGSIRSTPQSWGRARRAGGVALAVILLATLASTAQAGTKSDLAHAKARLVGYKRPKYVVLADALPKNPSGKILKRELREKHADLAAGS